jgi:hypothetical protein
MATAAPVPPAATAKRQSLLARKLSALNYTLPPTTLTAPLTSLLESLFTDLVSTTEAYENLQTKEEGVAHELSKAQAQVFPLRKENARLLRENNQLHLELIKAEDETGKTKQSHELELSGLKQEIGEAKFLSEQKDASLAKARAEADHLKLQLKAMLSGGGGAPSLRTTEEQAADAASENADPNTSHAPSSSSPLPPSPSRRPGSRAGSSSSPHHGDARVLRSLEAQLAEVKGRMETSEAEVS